MTRNYLISTDLDGTLIDHHSYSFEAALPALQLCKECNVPVILNTSKTLSETRVLQHQLGLTAPVIVENGSALFLSADEFEAQSMDALPLNSEKCKVFGSPRSELLQFIDQVRASYKWQFEGFNDWSVQQVVEQTGLATDDAERARLKLFSEPFVWHDSADALELFTKLCDKHGMQILRGGRFYHLQGQTDKAKPLRWIMDNYDVLFSQDTSGQIDSDSATAPTLICLGDNQNDVAMLNIADLAVCVRSPIANYPELTNTNLVIRTEGYGPVGWTEAVSSILESDHLTATN